VLAIIHSAYHPFTHQIIYPSIFYQNVIYPWDWAKISNHFEPHLIGNLNPSYDV